MGKPLPLTLLRVINLCLLHDTNGMSLPDDITRTLSKHGGSLCYIPPCLSVDDLGQQGEHFRSHSEFERTTLLSETCPLSRHTHSTPSVDRAYRSPRGRTYRACSPSISRSADFCSYLRRSGPLQGGSGVNMLLFPKQSPQSGIWMPSTCVIPTSELTANAYGDCRWIQLGHPCPLSLSVLINRGCRFAGRSHNTV
jgi:hypothetical protein